MHRCVIQTDKYTVFEAEKKRHCLTQENQVNHRCSLPSCGYSEELQNSKLVNSNVDVCPL